MCGIVGYTTMAKSSPEVIKIMASTLVHRGPDDVAYYSSRLVKLGMRRLSIIDLTPNIYPMRNEKGNLFCIFNGEIYNFKELRETLIGMGHQFKTKCDGEVLVHAYEEWGEKFLVRLNGMFALAIWDEKKENLFLARDRLGVKPLYYTMVGSDLVFGSEIKAILSYPQVKKSPNYKVFGSYFSFRYIVGEETFFESIFSLSPGNFLLWHKGKLKKGKYWDLPVVEHKEDRGEKYYFEKTRLLVEESIKKRMISDVPLGAFLSGGLDSSIIVAVMSKFSSSAVKTFSIGFSEDGFNEFEYSRKVAEMFKTSHKEIILKGIDYVNLMPELIRYKDAPLSVPNEVPLMIMSRELKKIFTVVLSGEGADELFGGYGRIFRSPFDFQRLRTCLPFLRKFLLPNLYRKYGNYRPENIFDFFLNQYRYISLKEQEQLFSTEVNKIVNRDDYGRQIFRFYFEKTKNLSFYDQFLYVFQKLHLLGLLYRVDVTTMAAGVEGRVPFVDDTDLIEFVNAVPFKYKIHWNSFIGKIYSLYLNSDQISEKYDTPKYLLKKCFEANLPKKIIYRKKIGFPVPLDNWFRGSFRRYAEDILLSPRCKKRGIYNPQNVKSMLKSELGEKFGMKIWMMINLELWFRQYFD